MRSLASTSRCVRSATKAPAPSAVSALPRPVVVRASSGQTPDLSKLADKGKEFVGKASEAIKSVDMDKVKETVSNLSAAGVKDALGTALSFYDKFDADGDGKLQISEAVELLNSPEVTGVVEKVTGQPHTKRTADDIKKWFDRADFDKTGSLSKREFAVLYTGLLADKAKAGLAGFATAAIQALDSDNDGIINSTDLKALLAKGPLAPIVAAIPDGKEVNYRELLSKLPGGLGGAKE